MTSTLTRTNLIFYTLFSFCHFFFNDTATTEIYTLSLHDALPISLHPERPYADPRVEAVTNDARNYFERTPEDRKSTRLNSSHVEISYAVFCLKKKNQRGKVQSISYRR